MMATTLSQSYVPAQLRDFTPLTDPNTVPGDFDAIGLIRTLLQGIAVGIPAPKFSAHTTLYIAQRAGEHYKSIHNLIKSVDSGESNEPDWTSFDKYTKAIDPLEDLLFEFYAQATFSSSSSKDLFPITTEVPKIQTSLELWKAERANLVSTIKKVYGDDYKDLSEQPSNAEQIIHGTRKHDDITFLEELLKRMNEISLKETDLRPLMRNQAPISNIKLHGKAIHDNLKAFDVSEALSELSLRSVMLVCMALEAASDPSVGRESPLRSFKVWKIAKDLLSKAATDIKDKAEGLEELKAKYEEFLKAIGGVVEHASTLIELVKLAAHVKRPYLAQSLAIISVLRALSKLEDLGDGSAYQSSINKAVAALQKAKEDTTQFKDMNPEEFPKKEVSDAFAAAKDQFKVSFKDEAAWGKHKLEIEAAAKKDKERLTTLLARLKPSDKI